MQIRREIEDIFLGTGYQVWDGAEVATRWENFDALTQRRAIRRAPQFHTFYVNDDTAPRMHTSPDQIRAMHSARCRSTWSRPAAAIAAICPTDALADLHPGPTSAVDRGIMLADLQGTALQAPPRAVRPGARGSYAHELLPVHRAVGRVRRDLLHLQRPGLRHLEALGVDRTGRPGWVDPDVFRKGGDLDPAQWQGFAFGFGIERIALRCATACLTCAFWRTTCASGAVLMKVPVSWLGEYVDFYLPIQESARQLGFDELRGRSHRALRASPNAPTATTNSFLVGRSPMRSSIRMPTSCS